VSAGKGMADIKVSPFFWAMQEVNLSLEKCYEMWEDRERIPQWMPWITSVKVQISSTLLHEM
jgi:uncharacterized membrane protein